MRMPVNFICGKAGLILKRRRSLSTLPGRTEMELSGDIMRRKDSRTIKAFYVMVLGLCLRQSTPIQTG